jgi:hypothetical protein
MEEIVVGRKGVRSNHAPLTIKFKRTTHIIAARSPSLWCCTSNLTK